MSAFHNYRTALFKRDTCMYGIVVVEPTILISAHHTNVLAQSLV